MESMAKISIMVNRDGQVVAAQLSTDEHITSEKGAGISTLAPTSGHRLVEVLVPRELLRLSGADLGRFFAGVHMDHKGEIRLPTIEVSKSR